MRGVAKGETSTTGNPLIQFFCRSGEFLVDIYSGNYLIDDISTGSVSNKVASTPITIAMKLGTGRYALPTGTTSSWTIGSHRAVITYKLTSTGSTYTQVIPFEVLTAADWASGSLYNGYIPTRQLIDDGYAASTYSVAKMHKHINRISRQLEGWLHRVFEPRYQTYYLEGLGTNSLLFSEAIIAIDKAEAIEKDATNTVIAEEYDHSTLNVYNRHLDGLSAYDDRFNPRVVLPSSVWPTGYQTIRVSGVFGFTDPDYEATADRVGLGHTPEELIQVLGILTSRAIADPTMSNPAGATPGAIQMMKTRDQTVQFGAGSGAVGSSSLTGDPTLDRLLIRFHAPISLSYADEREIVTNTREDEGIEGSADWV